MRSSVALSLLLLACSGDPATCDGGGDPALEIGEGNRDSFVAFPDGGTYEGSNNTIDLALWTTGLDTTQAITTVVRISVDGGATTDSIAALTYQCAEASGNGWTSATALLPPAAADGSAVRIQVSATDHLSTNATLVLEGTLAL